MDEATVRFRQRRGRDLCFFESSGRPAALARSYVANCADRRIVTFRLGRWRGVGRLILNSDILAGLAPMLVFPTLGLALFDPDLVSALTHSVHLILHDVSNSLFWFFLEHGTA
jgi:hypothetical protein